MSEQDRGSEETARRKSGGVEKRGARSGGGEKQSDEKALQKGAARCAVGGDSRKEWEKALLACLACDTGLQQLASANRGP